MRISIYTLFLTGSSPRFYLLKNSHSFFIKGNKIYFIGIFINLSIKGLIGSFQIKLFFINKSIPVIEDNHRRAFHSISRLPFKFSVDASVWSIGILTVLFASPFGVFRPVAVKPYNFSVSFEGQDMGANSVQKPAVMAYDED